MFHFYKQVIRMHRFWSQVTQINSSSFNFGGGIDSSAEVLGLIYFLVILIGIEIIDSQAT